MTNQLITATIPERSCATLRKNDLAQAVLAVAQELDLPDWYFGAGGVAQTVWNVLHGFQASAAIKDYDLAYFGAADLRIETESEIEAEVADRLRGGGIVVDVKNEARVHLWYERRFGRHLEPYRSTGDAIATWPTTASSVGVRYDGHTFVVCAPFGLADLSEMRMHPRRHIEAIFWPSRDSYFMVRPLRTLGSSGRIW
jgi:hypothetical protein